jgi:hypothetical protein
MLLLYLTWMPRNYDYKKRHSFFEKRKFSQKILSEIVPPSFKNLSLFSDTAKPIKAQLKKHMLDHSNATVVLDSLLYSLKNGQVLLIDERRFLTVLLALLNRCQNFSSSTLALKEPLLQLHQFLEIFNLNQRSNIKPPTIPLSINEYRDGEDYFNKLPLFRINNSVDGALKLTVDQLNTLACLFKFVRLVRTPKTISGACIDLILQNLRQNIFPKHVDVFLNFMKNCCKTLVDDQQKNTESLINEPLKEYAAFYIKNNSGKFSIDAHSEQYAIQKLEPRITKELLFFISFSLTKTTPFSVKDRLGLPKNLFEGLHPFTKRILRLTFERVSYLRNPNHRTNYTNPHCDKVKSYGFKNIPLQLEERPLVDFLASFFLKFKETVEHFVCCPK